MVVETLLLDIGGCEGCPLAILRSLPIVSDKIRLYARQLGNLDLDKKYDIAFISGPVCLNEERIIKMLRKIRSNAEIVIAFGSCAAVGGVTRFCRGGQDPRPDHRIFQPVSSVIEADYAIPGCPPAPQIINTLIDNLVHRSGPFLKIFASVVKARKLSGFDLLDDIVLSGLCISCGACILSCPTGALQMIEKKPDLIVEKCIRCGTCYVRCPRASQILLKRFPSQIKTITRKV